MPVPGLRDGILSAQTHALVEAEPSCTAANASIFDHFVGARERRHWNVEDGCPGVLRLMAKSNLGGRLRWQLPVATAQRRLTSAQVIVVIRSWQRADTRSLGSDVPGRRTELG